MIKAVAFFFGFVLAISAGIVSAGYYVTGIGGSTKVGNSTSCYLTPSMAANALYSPGGYPVLTSLSLENGAGYFSGASHITFSFGVTACTAAPLATALPIFLGGVHDPIITSGSYGSGGSSSGGSCAQSDLWMLSPEEGSQIAGGVLLLWAIGWAFRSLIHVVKHSDLERSES
jgi:hypothetical protein